MYTHRLGLLGCILREEAAESGDDPVTYQVQSFVSTISVPPSNLNTTIYLPVLVSASTAISTRHCWFLVIAQGIMAEQKNVKHLEDCSVSNALGTWVFSVAGALLAIPVGIKRKSLAPLVFFGTTGTMLDIIMGISACEREHAERQMKLLEAQNAAADKSFTEAQTDS
ncbi:hypothetical protein L6164_009411 [Bauhinia variegata]|uniref:Uncharacterized protein n=1 Tax=Bauhinia variegata TaxID=167791 RepID=A0ACB9PL46_BAUVA|nr:hypothetical protein L6164_009411 [Bauhinia variegata]